MKKLAIILSIMLFSGMANAQRYRDIFPQIINAEDNDAFEILNAFLQQNFDHPNANLRMAQIYIKRYKQEDVLRNYEKAMALAEQAKYKLVKTQVVLDEKEVKKNRDYYLGLLENSDFSYQAISAYVDEELAAVEEFMTQVPRIYHEFTRSVEKYDEVVKEYAKIVGERSSLKELYLLYNTREADRLNLLKMNYDSTKYYFDEYLLLRTAYPINAVKQSYTEKPIKVYRLDGLVSQINFLQPKIELWDYAAWVDTVKAVVNTDIANLRSSLIENDNRLKDAIEQAEQITSPDSFRIVTADKALKFNLMKYDYKNAIVPYLNYQEFKQKIIVGEKRKTYFDTAKITIERKLAYFNDRMYTALEADSILLDFESKYSAEQLTRHAAFISSTFGSAEDFKAYMSGQKKVVNQLFLTQIGNIKKAILNISKTKSSGEEVKYGKYTLPTDIIDKPLDELGLNYLQTKKIVKSADENYYLAGHIITNSKSKNRRVMVAKVDAKHQVVWAKIIDSGLKVAGARANQFLGDLRITAEGAAAIIQTSSADSAIRINTLVHITSGGEIKFEKQVSTKLIPREVRFEEEKNMFILAFFGREEHMDISNEDSLAVFGINGLGEEVWNFDYKFSGNYLGMQLTTDKILIAGNYQKIIDHSGVEYATPQGSNSFVLSLEFSGHLQKIKCYASDTSYQATIFYKVGDNNLNLIGKNGEHIILNNTLENIYSSVMLK